MADNIIEISGLCKSFGEVKAVQELSFRVKRGELFAFLGVNGAGKSTTISILCGQLARDAGSVCIDGIDIDKGPDAIRRKLGVVFQRSVLDRSLTVRDNLECRAALYGITGKAFRSRLAELSSLLELDGLQRRIVGNLSGGQRRRIDIARALFHRPQILVLDEPTTGLDPQTRRNVWRVIGQLRESDGLTVFLTTHYMEEAADADYVVILDSGRKVADGTPLSLKNEYAGDYLTVYGLTPEQAQSVGLPYRSVRDGYRFTFGCTAEVTRLIMQRPELFSDYEVTKGRMDDVFLSVTGKQMTGGGCYEGV